MTFRGCEDMTLYAGQWKGLARCFMKRCSSRVATDDPRYRNALFYLLISQMSCYRYWGQGLWVDYGREICRRATEILIRDF